MSLPLRHKLISWVSRTFFDNIRYRVIGGLNDGLWRRGGLGWWPGKLVTPELEFWSQLKLDEKVVYDIGAFHGLLTIFFASRCRCVVAWEPTEKNRARLLENVELNGFQNVTVRPYALGNSSTSVLMRYDVNAPGAASADPTVSKGSLSEIVEIRTLDEERDLPAPDLIKVDTEGFELSVLQGATQLLTRKPALFLEMHGANDDDKRKRVEAIVAFLWERGYTELLHVESGTYIFPENAHLASRGHIYALSKHP